MDQRVCLRQACCPVCYSYPWTLSTTSQRILSLQCTEAVAGVQGIFLPLAIYGPLGRVLRCMLWLGAWLVIMDNPIVWARQAAEWNGQAGVTVWREEFRDVHFYVVRTLISYLLYKAAMLLKEAASSYLELTFLHETFFKRMLVRVGMAWSCLFTCCCRAPSTKAFADVAEHNAEREHSLL